LINSLIHRLNIVINELSLFRMKFEVKTEPVCVVFAAVTAYFAVVVITLGTGVPAYDAWFAQTVVVTIFALTITVVYANK